MIVVGCGEQHRRDRVVVDDKASTHARKGRRRAQVQTEHRRIAGERAQQDGGA
jgi:hypothetical protein